MKETSTITKLAALALLLGLVLTTSCKRDCSNIDDATLSANVKAALAKKMAPKVANGINVECKDKTCTLSGKINNPATKEYATQIAKSVECVKEVVNNVTVAILPGCGQGEHQCCCPDSGCECVPSSQQCQICLPK